MNTTLVARALKNHNQSCHNHFLGVFPADKIPTHPIADTCFVANTDPHYLPGTHWVAFYISPVKRAFYFDSFGLPPRNIIFNNFLNKTGYKWRYNKKQ